jgi:serine/threonine protein kinase
MSDYHDFYRLDATPIGDGGQAHVFRAQNRDNGEFVALKRRKGALDEAKDRMRREIEIQSSINHPNVMPILDFDRDEYQWFTMPLAENSCDKLSLPIDSTLLAQILKSAAEGVQAAHLNGFVHRDIKPSNVLLLQNGNWVVADWGIVRRPHGQTTVKHTKTGVLLGSEGFAPPEAHDAAHAATTAWDSYSLGRVAAWGSTGKSPVPNIELIAPEPWRRFVRVLTDPTPTRRPQNMTEVLQLLARVGTEPAVVASVSQALLDAAKAGDKDAGIKVLHASVDTPDDAEFFIDEVAQVIGDGLDHFVRDHPADARNLLHLMEKHFSAVEWYGRDFDYLNVPLHWIQSVAEAAASAGNLDLLEDACESLFRLEPATDRWAQARRSRAWLESLSGDAAARAAQVLRDHSDAARYYGVLKDARDPRIRAVLREAVNKRE